MLGAVLYLLGVFPKAGAGKLGAWVRKSSGVLFVFAAALLLTRNIGVAILGGMLAYSFMQKTGWIPGAGWKRTAQGSLSAVRTAYLEITFDHRTGLMSGHILKGRFAGRSLSDFTAGERRDCLAELRQNDAQAARLFEAYLDRTSPGWNGTSSFDGGRGPGSRGMGADEAYLVLGLTPGASRTEIQAAHRNLMKRFHPDQGGSTYLAAKVNEAKDVLLKSAKA